MKGLALLPFVTPSHKKTNHGFGKGKCRVFKQLVGNSVRIFSYLVTTEDLAVHFVLSVIVAVS